MHNGERSSGTGREVTAKQNQWEKMASDAPPFNPDQKGNDQTSEYDYDVLRQQIIEERAQTRSAERQTELRKDVNVEALLSEGDEELAKWARRIDNSSFAVPGQEDAADKRLAEAMAGYKRASELRDAEREVLEDIQDYDRTRYSQDELIDRLRERQFDIRREKQDGGLENWLQQSQACDRLIRHLEKFNPEIADQLDDNDMAYWKKITGPAQQIPAEDLVPKTLSQADLVQLTSSSSAVDKAKQRMVSKYNAFRQQVPNTETGPSDGAEAGMEEALEPVTKTDEQIAAERQRAIADVREKVTSVYRQEEKQPTSYHFEAGMEHGGATITVGQEIPDEWFEAGVLADVRNENGFGINWKGSPRIDDYLQQALNIEFSKLSESERQYYNYAELAQQIKEEARRTRKMPDIAAIIKANEQEITM